MAYYSVKKCLILITNQTIISYIQTFGCFKSRINLSHLLKYGNLHKHQLWLFWRTCGIFTIMSNVISTKKIPP